MDNFFKIINKYHSWINPILILVTTMSSAFLTYQFPNDFATKHPARYQFFKPLVDNVIPIFIVTLILLAFVTFIEIKNKKTITKLQKENEEYLTTLETVQENIKELFNGFLYRFSTSKANFETDERVTLYIHNGDNSFVPFGRYSQNPKYSKQGRDSYPENEGCIAKGWENKWHFDNTFSDDDREYLEENKKNYFMDNKIVKKLKMKSKLFAVLRLNQHDRPIAVIVVESTNKKKYSMKEIKTILEEQESYIADMIVSLEKYISAPSYANELEEL